MNNELKHFGVLGMKWGKHKARPVGTSLKSSKIDGRTYYHDSDGVVVSTRRKLSNRNKRFIDREHEKGVAAVASLYASGISSAIADHNIRKKTRKLDESYNQIVGDTR